MSNERCRNRADRAVSARMGHHENPYVPRVSRILRYRRGHGVLTHNPKFEVESAASLCLMETSEQLWLDAGDRR
ncbi:MAG: hypothetical protein QGD91_12770, partial [Actinomycetota bacterium]|nr:hypothetical protein [Actinomycetota bacterium]